MALLNVFAEIVGPYGVKIEIIDSINSSSVSGYLYFLIFYIIIYLAIKDKNSGKSTLPV
jgi:hypothetical protein